MNDENIGNSFDDSLKDEAMLEEATAVTLKRVIASQIAEEMKAQHLTETDLAKRMHISDESLDRLLDAEDASVTLLTLASAASALGKKISFRLEAEKDAADALPSDIVEAMAICNAVSIDQQPAILANMALAQQVFNQNMEQQLALSRQQAMNLIQLVATAKCVAMIENIDTCKNTSTIDQMVQDMKKVIGSMNVLYGQEGKEG